MHVIVPVKSFAHAKSRLSTVLDGALRRRLARAMARSVLVELAQVRAPGRILVVTSEPEMVEIAQSLGIESLRDGGVGGLNGALAEAEGWLGPADDGIAVVCADLPFFRAAEFERMRAAHAALGPTGVTIASDHAGAGTNVRMVTGAGRFPYLYGARSARAHTLAARKAGAPHQLFASETFALDLDTPADVARVFQTAAGQAGQAQAVRTILSSRPGAPPEISSHGKA
ncbi:2-phospho-L-lactate guanylyltransferase [Camelimonas lactis]|uniref:3-phospho-D-glycerate guanylyltransferase n=1 Tax=Camelimonas lactis TaxID=659006 RepID=A0A4R2GLI3_9HYPH|nr:2-phospho-L-lactate guanylyltransferase [Camelimonas lactis]TCO09480.1 2-phospho-L-lactate guanylyltransferase [Camelimonas lactis]